MSVPVPVCPKYRMRAQVCEIFGVSEDRLLDRTRDGAVIQARYAFAYAAKARWPDLSYPRIARMLNRDCHSTVIHGLRSFSERLARDPSLREVVARLIAERPAIQQDAHVRTWRENVQWREIERERAIQRSADIEESSGAFLDTVAEAVRVVSLSRTVKPKNALATDDRDALRRKVGSDALGKAIAAAGGWPPASSSAAVG